MKRLLSVALAGAVAALVGLAGAAEAQFYKGKRKPSGPGGLKVPGDQRSADP